MTPFICRWKAISRRQEPWRGTSLDLLIISLHFYSFAKTASCFMHRLLAALRFTSNRGISTLPRRNLTHTLKPPNYNHNFLFRAASTHTLSQDSQHGASVPPVSMTQATESYGNYDLVKRVKLDFTDVAVSKWKSRETGLTVIHLDYEGVSFLIAHISRLVLTLFTSTYRQWLFCSADRK